MPDDDRSEGIEYTWCRKLVGVDGTEPVRGGGDFKPGDFNPGDLSVGDFNPGDFRPGDVVTLLSLGSRSFFPLDAFEPLEFWGAKTVLANPGSGKLIGSDDVDVFLKNGILTGASEAPGMCSGFSSLRGVPGRLPS